MQLGNGIPTADLTVRLVSGRPLTVMSANEADWLRETRESYVSQTRFTDVSDLQDVDRLLALELMVFRWTQWLSSGVDYFGDEIDEARISSDLKGYSAELNRLKQSMGLSKAVRDAAANDGNFSAWFDDVKRRAKAFSIHRQEQLGKTLALLEELSAIVGTYDRSDEEERERTGFKTEHEILEWVRNTALPEYRALDAHFREFSQSLYIRNQ